MKIKEIRLENFRAYKDVTIELDDFNCIVGRNDVGKSTILAALDWFFNDNIIIKEEDFNVDGYDFDEETESTTDDYGNTVGEVTYKCVRQETTSLSVSICFSEIKIKDYNYLWEEFLDENGNIWIEKTADYPYDPYEDYEHDEQEFPIITKLIQRYDNIVSHNTYKIRAKIFKDIDKPLNDFSEEELKTEYIKIGGDPDIFNDLRGFHRLFTLRRVQQEIFDYYTEQGIEKKDYSKQIDETFKLDHLSSFAFPKFELFKSDITLEELLNRVFSNEITQSIKERKYKIANLMQQYITNEKIRFHNNDIVIDAFAKDYFEFEKEAVDIPNKVNVPMSNRGDGFKLKMQYAILRYLSEQQDDNTTPRVFAFEEPETHLHPSAQIDMYDAIRELSNNQMFQVIITTHSPTIVSQCSPNEIIQVVKDDKGLVCVRQHNEDIVNDVIKDLGITPNSKIISELGFKKCYVFVEGKYDVDFFKHIFKLRGINDEHIGYIPMGSGDNVGLWVNKKLVDALNKPYIFIIDSDNKNKTDKYSIEPNRIHILNKRETENYLKPESLEQLSILSNNPNSLQKYKSSWDNVDIPLVLFVEKNNINMQSKIEFNAEDVKKSANEDAAYLTNYQTITKQTSVTTDGVKNRADKLKGEINKFFFEDGNATLADLDFEYKDENGNTKDEFEDIYNKIKTLCEDI